jgi:hypothetical protein
MKPPDTGRTYPDSDLLKGFISTREAVGRVLERWQHEGPKVRGSESPKV